MEPQYHQFGSTDGSSVQFEHRATALAGMRKVVGYILYGVLVLLLLLLLLVTGIKFSVLSMDISEVKLQLARISGGGLSSAPSSAAQTGAAAAATPVVYLEKLIPERGRCREGWVSFQSSCYLASTLRHTWSAAEQQCKTNRGHLVVLNNAAELDFISGFIELSHNYWIGLVERQHEGHWSWVDGTDFSSTPTFWDMGQPDDWDYMENGEDCGQLHASAKRKRRLWNDADCSLSYRYICESRE